ncbi:MAG TPA: carboxypeptidase-like regulatory domain-containing protein, partial [Candidatus Sulfotelmatobacter sp.]
MSICWIRRTSILGFVAVLLIFISPVVAATSGTSWNGKLIDGAGKTVAEAVVTLHSAIAGHDYTATTAANGKFVFAEIAAGSYEVSVTVSDRVVKSSAPVIIKDASLLTMSLQIAAQGEGVRLVGAGGEGSAQASGGEHLSSAEVSSLPLNARDFSKLLLLAAGTMTDANGAANFTQQFAVNGQRGVATVFAMDGFDTTDPELGGATFSNFNVDA